MQVGGDVVGLIGDALAVVGPARREDLIADGMAIDPETIGAECGGVEARGANGLVEVEAAAEHHDGIGGPGAGVERTGELPLRCTSDGLRPCSIVEARIIPGTRGIQLCLPVGVADNDLVGAILVADVKAGAHGRAAGVASGRTFADIEKRDIDSEQIASLLHRGGDIALHISFPRGLFVGRKRFGIEHVLAVDPCGCCVFAGDVEVGKLDGVVDAEAEAEVVVGVSGLVVVVLTTVGDPGGGGFTDAVQLTLLVADPLRTPRIAHEAGLPPGDGAHRVGDAVLIPRLDSPEIAVFGLEGWAVVGNGDGAVRGDATAVPDIGVAGEELFAAAGHLDLVSSLASARARVGELPGKMRLHGVDTEGGVELFAAQVLRRLKDRSGKGRRGDARDDQNGRGEQEQPERFARAFRNGLHAPLISWGETADVNRKEILHMKQWVPILPGLEGTVDGARLPEGRSAMRSRMMAMVVVAFLGCCVAAAQETAEKAKAIDINWDKTVIVSKSTPTLQVVTNPMLNPGSPIHDGAFAALKMLGADYVRFVPWLPYPKIAVAELQPPTADHTSWDFTYIDPVTKDFLAATEGHSTIMNFSTIPAWMFQNRQARDVSGGSQSGVLELHAGDRVARSERKGVGGLLRTAGELVHEGRLHRREREAA
jgi:hypothetical protein